MSNRIVDIPLDTFELNVLELLADNEYLPTETRKFARLELLRRLDIHTPFDTIRAAERVLHEDGRHILADELYAAGCELGSRQRRKEPNMDKLTLRERLDRVGDVFEEPDYEPVTLASRMLGWMANATAEIERLRADLEEVRS